MCLFKKSSFGFLIFTPAYFLLRNFCNLNCCLVRKKTITKEKWYDANN